MQGKLGHWQRPFLLKIYIHLRFKGIREIISYRLWEKIWKPSWLSHARHCADHFHIHCIPEGARYDQQPKLMLFRLFPIPWPRHKPFIFYGVPPYNSQDFCAFLFKDAFVALSSHPVVKDLTNILENCLGLARAQSLLLRDYQKWLFIEVQRASSLLVWLYQ